MTGVAVALLFELAEQLGRRAELVASLRRTTTVCRGPKPTAALRGFGVPPTLNAREPFTAAELIDALAGHGARGQARAALQLRRAQRDAGRDAARAPRRAARVLAVSLADARGHGAARATSAQDRGGESTRSRSPARSSSATFTRWPSASSSSVSWCSALNDRVVVGAVGPTCRAILEAYGVQPHVMPDHPKMGPLVAALMRHSISAASARRANARPRATDFARCTRSFP